jgi:hypothetical protein
VVCRDFLNRQRAKSEALGRHASILDECAGEGRIHAGQTKVVPENSYERRPSSTQREKSQCLHCTNKSLCIQGGLCNQDIASVTTSSDPASVDRLNGRYRLERMDSKVRVEEGEEDPDRGGRGY